jgi:predicted dehydrogenase
MPFPEARWNAAKQGWILDRRRSGGGALVHSGSHVLDIVQWFCGPVMEVAGNICCRPDLPDIDYLAQAMLWTQLGAVLFLEIGWLPLTGIGHRQDGWDEVFAVTGDQGMLTARTNWWNQVETSRTTLELYKESDQAKRLMTFGPPDHFNREVQGFVETIKAGGQPLVGIEEGYRVQLVIDAIYRSARQDERVAVNTEA